jgi:small GTP-binding protein
MSDSKQSTGNKIVLLGDSGVGKTCIISRFISGQFDANVNSTNGASYASKKIEYPHLKKTLVLDIWDTAGQEKYKSLTKFFYKDAQMIILVYDITRRESFDNLKNYWYKEIQEYGEKNLVLGIAGNKSDLYDNEAVPESEAREFAKSINAIFALTSAQNNSGVNKLFEDIGNKYLDPNFQEKVQDTKGETDQDKGITLDKEQVKEKNKEHKKKKGFC